jgi:SAM-dependent methyltransferase
LRSVKLKKKLLRLLGVSFLIDGLLTLLFGRKHVQWCYFGPTSSPYKRSIEWIQDRPPWQLRLAGASEFILGTMLLSRAPLDVRTFYRSVARSYAAIDPGWREWFYPKAHSAFDSALSHYLPPKGRVLDLGSGVGANLSRLLDMNLPFNSYVGVDLTDAMLEQARKRYHYVSNARFQQLDLMTDPLPEGPFDLITSTWVFEHLPDPVYVVKKALERLSTDGHIILLFETKSNTLLSQIIDRVFPFFSIRLVREDQVHQFPGILLEQHHSGPLGDLALVVLEKPDVFDC